MVGAPLCTTQFPLSAGPSGKKKTDNKILRVFLLITIATKKLTKLHQQALDITVPYSYFTCAWIRRNYGKRA